MTKQWLPIALAVLGVVCFCSCSDEETTGPSEPKAPTVLTAEVSGITETTAECGGTITSDGGAAVTACGVCWSTEATPSTGDNVTTDDDTDGTFTSSLTGLAAGTAYYVCAYATNSVGTGYGAAEPFTTAAAPITVTDIDGNVYETVTIGDQVWMAENLKVTHYRNGDEIPNVTDGFAWDALTIGAFCRYNNSLDTGAIYGNLYNWYAVNDSRNIAPEGWHVPTRQEWIALAGYAGQNPGGQLKDTGTTYWLSPNEGATNATGFTALPGGERGYQGLFGALGQEAYFWTATESEVGRAYTFSLYFADASVWDRNLRKSSGHSVRCVKD